MATGKYKPTETELRLLAAYGLFRGHFPAELKIGRITGFAAQRIYVQRVDPAGKHENAQSIAFRGQFVAAFDTFEAARDASDGYRDAYKLGTASVEQAKAKLAEAQGWRETSATEAAQRGGLPRSGVAS